MNHTYRFVPFCDELLKDAAELLAARHRRDRVRCPALCSHFAEPQEALKAVEAAWRRPWATGSAVFQSDQLVGYLFADARFDQLLGRTAWIRLAGHALSEQVEVDLYKDLYAAAAPQWLHLGCFDHYVMALAGDHALLDVWYALSFGQQQAYGLRPITAEDSRVVETRSNVTVRLARPEDRTEVVAMASFTAQHQVQAPVWAPVPAELAAGRPDAYAGILDDQNATLWLALKENQVIGFQVYYPAELEADTLFIPERCAELSAAATRPEWRGQGVGHALSQAGFKHLYEQGYAYCLADWRTTNRLASRFWPHQGFQPVVYRLHRRIDERILWAKG
jgi:ribosomal protein S18 acetylase RimI-like enzyme